MVLYDYGIISVNRSSSGAYSECLWSLVPIGVDTDARRPAATSRLSGEYPDVRPCSLHDGLLSGLFCLSRVLCHIVLVVNPTTSRLRLVPHMWVERVIAVISQLNSWLSVCPGLARSLRSIRH